MNSMFLQQGVSGQIGSFPHIRKFGMKKIQTVRINSFPVAEIQNLSIYFILEGRFEWFVRDKTYTLYPDDLAILLPGERLGGSKGFLDIGCLCWLSLDLGSLSQGTNGFGSWSGLLPPEIGSILKVLLMRRPPVLTSLRQAGAFFQSIGKELQQGEIGYITSVNHRLDELLILIARQFTRQNNAQRDFPKTFANLEHELRSNLSHQWTVEEMAALVGLGTTVFTEKVKIYTGFSPMNYLTNIRISEVIRLLKKTGASLTDIALDTGFYSSQHFSTTFKKITGYTPSQFRKNNFDNL